MTHSVLFKILKLAKKWLFINLRFPSLPPCYVETNWSQWERSIDPTELKLIQANASTAPKWPTILIMWIYFLYAVRNIIFLTVSYSMYDYENLESNLVEKNIKGTSNETEKLFKFACVETNCSRFSAINDIDSNRRALAHQFGELPLFTLCNPKFDSILTPIVHLESFGMLATTGCVFYVLLVGVWVPLRQLVSPAAEEALLFLSAPQASIQVMGNNCKRLVFDLNVSYRNFCAQTLLKHHRDARHKWAQRRDVAPKLSGSSNCIPRCSSSNNNNSNCACRLSIVCGNSTDVIGDCLPVIRTSWWRSKMIVSFCLQLAGATISVGAFVGVIFWYIYARLDVKYKQLNEFQKHTEQTNCKLWTDIDGDHLIGDYLNFNEINGNWTLRQTMETGGLNFFPGFSAVMLAVTFYIFYCELSCWVAELQAYLLSCLTWCHFKPRCRCSCCRSEFYALRSATFSMSRMKEQFLGQVHLFGGVLLMKRTQEGRLIPINSEWGETSSVQRIARQLYQMSDGQCINRHPTNQLDCCNRDNNNDDHSDDHDDDDDDDDDMNVETLEKIYIQFRLFLDYVQNLSPCMTLLTSFIYIFTYGQVLVGVFFSSKVKNLTVEPMVVIIVGWMLSNVFIIVAANFHANTKRLEVLVWSIVAQLARSNNLRVQHLSRLWIKQMQMLDQEGDGIAMKASKIRITYVNLIQVLIWTGTILVLTLKPY